MSLLVGDLVMMIVSGRGMWKCVSDAHIWALGVGVGIGHQFVVSGLVTGEQC